ncbi:MAG: ATP-dependent DNA helicase RecG [Candidatus Saganbacteria bacterium]|uniref:ATP-dependent DNA helicase RecG n=1 Tax=Candidatus Saganbacteria bacterium TaxID=2575572 RepID=A0A833L2K1_UNCSA|nr:MAG: ATP-dependent DNA helicase RecG [Candidatus Saganbacteria bacterium]
MPIQYLKGVGPKLAKIFAKIDVFTVEDLLYYFPREYEDRSKIMPIRQISIGLDKVLIIGQIDHIELKQTRNRLSIIKIIMSDNSGQIKAVFFNQPFLMNVFRPGMKILLSGRPEVDLYEGGMQIIAKDWDFETTLSIIPVYSLTDGLYPKKIRNLMFFALENYSDLIIDNFPDSLKSKHDLISKAPAVKSLHFPENFTQIEKARYRIVFEEFFIFQMGLNLNKKITAAEKGIALKIPEKLVSSFMANLPFSLTTSQKKVFDEIKIDLANDYSMNRLLQGDVGSGKTIIAVLSALIAINNGYQAAVMAPTEILANQHFEKMSKLLPGYKIRLITSASLKQSCLPVAGADLLIGTHALIEEKIKIKKLGLVIIDEQHRFGVDQRAKLSEKGYRPNILYMSATPIPRSLALILYGDLERSEIDEMPVGRIPIKTCFVSEAKRKSSYEFMKKKIKEGRQIFVVCPLVEESEVLDLKAAIDEAKLLQNIFSEYKVGLIHGRMKSQEKEKVMEEFKNNIIQLLVSTTVIEVGIDIPNASIMVIEHAERFGLSQLHQLRGRVGRGDSESYCFLMSEPKTKEAKARIKAMIDHIDGFKIAEIDLKLRGPGDFFGTKQSGLPEFKLADIIKDEKILRYARSAAEQFILEDFKNASDLWESQRKAIKSS